LKIYCFSGLGADKRVFKNLSLQKQYELIHIDWIKPLEGESISAYALRISCKIDTSEPFSLLGLSFGGVIGIEVAKTLKPFKFFLISSIESTSELPFYLKAIRFLKLLHLVPESFLKQTNIFTQKLFGLKSKENIQLFKQIMIDSDPTFLKWAINVLLNWKNSQTIACIRIHGSNDRTLPAPLPNTYIHIIKGGGHYMVLDRAEEISSIINTNLNA
jgi:pimeloyl-ACP methyl ester carboxylesterase